MDDIRAPDVKELAEKDYIAGMKYKDIASKYDVSLNTVKSWKQRYKWSRKGVHTKEKVCTQKKNNKVKNKELALNEVNEVIENTELTDKQRLFCIYYIKLFNATKAYKKAYGCTYEVALVAGPRLLGNVRIKKEIEKLKKNKLNRIMLSEDDIFQMYIDIAFTDITDYLTFGQKEVIKVNSETGEETTYSFNYVDFNNSSEVDGTIISEVKQGKNGISVKLQDKMKALDFLAKHIGLLDIATQHKLKIEEEKLKLEKDRLSGNDEESNREGIEEFIKATTMSEKEIAQLFEGEEDGQEEKETD